MPQSRPTSARNSHGVAVPLAAARCDGSARACPSCDCRRATSVQRIGRFAVCGEHHRLRLTMPSARPWCELGGALRCLLPPDLQQQRRRGEPSGMAANTAGTICPLPGAASARLLDAVPPSALITSPPVRPSVQRAAAAYAPRLCRWIVASIVRTSFSACEAAHLRQSRLAHEAHGSPTQACVRMHGHSRSAACAASAPWVPVPS
jgi:hypothetical protein